MKICLRLIELFLRKNMHKLSAVIITKNEEKIIEKCLAAVEKIADEIIIIDTFSTDNTIEICKKFNAKTFQLEWSGFGPQKNFGIDKASYDCILALDADEVLTSKALEEIIQLKQDGLKGVYQFKFLHYYFGKFIKHGSETPGYKKRLFDKTFVRWNNDPVHEALVFPPDYPVINLSGFIEHYSYLSIEQYIAKANYYTTAGAKDLKVRHKKNYLFKMLFSPSFVFIKSYFLKAGFLEREM